MVRYLAFEKSPSIPDQSVRVDPSRGISLLDDQQTNELPDGELATIPQASTDLDAAGSNTSEQQHGAFFAMLDELQSFASSLDPEVAETELHHPSSAKETSPSLA